MKITDVKVLPIDRYLFVQVHTDEGIVGLGESGAWGYLEASGEVVKSFREYLIGKDPLRIEHHWQVLYRCTHFRGAAIMGALSAIDIALWDIAGKFFGVPAYQLLGGKCRDKARVYGHVIGRTKEELLEGCVRAKAEGFTAVGHMTPFLDESRSVPYFKTHTDKIQDAVQTVAAYREAVGDEVDLCIEIHRRLDPAEAIVLGRAIEPYRPFFYEDPIRPDNLDAMAEVAKKIAVPIATGERIHTIYEFEMLLTRNAVHYVRPDVCMAGGITHCKKIAALAEAHYVDVVPHNPLSPVSTAACVQLAACIPNFALQEYPRGEGEPPKSEIVSGILELEDGFLIIPDAPGIGVELVEGAMENYPFLSHRPLLDEGMMVTRLHVDGSVVDQ
ncbi:MAG: galactonate dehydratase [Candidatus Latescibacteria bacterium]|nr:galactonate dehydratase [Candidatus Latescibacterota bacterium]